MGGSEGVYLRWVRRWRVIALMLGWRGRYLRKVQWRNESLEVLAQWLRMVSWSFARTEQVREIQ
jgi:hypothetical protein